MAESLCSADEQDAPVNLISFLKAIPDGRYRRGVRYQQWYLLLVAVLGILSGCRSSRDLEAFAKRHRPVLNQALGLNFKRWPSDATFLYLFNQANLQRRRISTPERIPKSNACSTHHGACAAMKFSIKHVQSVFNALQTAEYLVEKVHSCVKPGQTLVDAV